MSLFMTTWWLLERESFWEWRRVGWQKEESSKCWQSTKIFLTSSLTCWPVKRSNFNGGQCTYIKVTHDYCFIDLHYYVVMRDHIMEPTSWIFCNLMRKEGKKRGCLLITCLWNVVQTILIILSIGSWGLICINFVRRHFRTLEIPTSGL